MINPPYIFGLKLGVKEALLLLILDREGPMGRYRLRRALDMTEGRVRGMLTRMGREGLLEASKLGCRLTDRGRETVESWMREHGVVRVEEVDLTELGVGPHTVLIQVRGGARHVRTGVEQRDVAVRHGALGAVNITFTGGKLSVPSVYDDLSRDHPALSKAIIERFKPSEGDLLVAPFAEDRYRALEAAIAVAMSLRGR